MRPTLFLGLTTDDWQTVAFSLVAAAAAVALSLPVGLPLGWLLARKSFPGKALLETAVNLPLVVPPVVTGYLLLLVLGTHGWLGAELDRWLGLRLAFTWRAPMIAGAIMGLPLLVRSVRLAFLGLDPRLYQAARSLGAGPLDAFFSVSLPLARHGVIAGCMLAFARALGEFGATLIFAGRQQPRMLSLQIDYLFEQPQEFQEQRMWRLVLASLLLAGAALVVSEYLERRGRRHEVA